MCLFVFAALILFACKLVMAILSASKNFCELKFKLNKIEEVENLDDLLIDC
jgi:hypothetical protein